MVTMLSDRTGRNLEGIGQARLAVFFKTASRLAGYRCGMIRKPQAAAAALLLLCALGTAPETLQ
jgi:hypothetical protein